MPLYCEHDGEKNRPSKVLNQFTNGRELVEFTCGHVMVVGDSSVIPFNVSELNQEAFADYTAFDAAIRKTQIGDVVALREVTETLGFNVAKAVPGLVQQIDELKSNNTIIERRYRKECQAHSETERQLATLEIEYSILLTALFDEVVAETPIIVHLKPITEVGKPA